MQDTIFELDLSIQYLCKYGYSVYLVGDHPNLGAWNPTQAIKLLWCKNDHWKLSMNLITSTPCPKYVQYKYIVAPTEVPPNETMVWENGPNRVINLRALSKNKFQAVDTWDYRPVRLTLNEIFTSNKYLKAYQPVVCGKVLDILGIKGPLRMRLEKMRVITRNRSEREELRWTTTFQLHHSISRFEYKYLIYDTAINKYILNRKLCQKFINPLFLGLASFNSTTSYQVLEGMVSKIDHVAYENFIYNKILPNVILGGAINNEYEIELLKSEGINHVLDVQTVADFSKHCSNYGAIRQSFRENKIGYTHFAIEERNFRKLVRGCRDGCDVLKNLLDESKVIYLHCAYGALRSVHTLLGYLVIHKKLSTSQAIELVSMKRKVALPSTELLNKIIKMDIQKVYPDKDKPKSIAHVLSERSI